MALLMMGHQLKEQPALRDAMYRLRHKLFVEELKWKLTSQDGMEFDQFDRDDTIYILYLDEGEILACFRLLPTTKPHLLSDVFHSIAEGYTPSGPHIWELSRYCFNNEAVMRRSPDDYMELFEHISASMVCTLCEFAFLHGITELVAEMNPGLVHNSVHLYGLYHVRQKPKEFNGEKVQICHYRPPFQSIRQQAAECFDVTLPATQMYDVYAQSAQSIRAAE